MKGFGERNGFWEKKKVLGEEKGFRGRNVLSGKTVLKKVLEKNPILVIKKTR